MITVIKRETVCVKTPAGDKRHKLKIPLRFAERDIYMDGLVSTGIQFPPQYYKEFFPIQKNLQTILFTSLKKM